MAAVAVGADISCEYHTADLGLVAWMPDHRAQLLDSVSELAVLPVRARACLFPLVAQFRFDHPLVVHVEFQRIFFLFCPWHVHSLLLPVQTPTAPKQVSDGKQLNS